MNALCELCRELPADTGDCLCVPCRVEVLAASETVHDPVEIVLSHHQAVELDNYKRLCLCGGMFDAPGYHRVHVATKIYEALGLPGPLPHTPASDEIDP